MSPTFSTAIITGATGFLGRALISLLLEIGVRVVALGRKELPGELGSRVAFYKADVTQAGALDGLPLAGGDSSSSTVLFHLAGLGHAGQCQQEPLAAVAVNVTGAVNAVEACRRIGVRRVVFPSTGLVYGLEARVPASEIDPVHPSSIYAATKLSAEALLQGFAQEFGMACDVARLGNVYGWGAAADAVHSILLRQAFQRRPLVVKTLKPIRDFIYVKDAADGLVRLGQAGMAAGFRLFNLATGQATSVRELARAICRVTGLPQEMRETEPQGLESDSTLVLSIGKLVRDVGWRPAWSLEAGIADALEQMRQSNR